MEPEERKMLEDLLKISQQNNRLLRRMRREVLISRYIHVLYWLVILGIAIAGYYYIQPYLGQLTNLFQATSSFLPK